LKGKDLKTMEAINILKMKRFILILIGLIFTLIVQAQVSKTVNVTENGLSSTKHSETISDVIPYKVANNQNMRSSSPEKDFEFDSATGTITKYKPLYTPNIVEIPQTINSVQVTALGESAFGNNNVCGSISSIIVPEGIVSIGKNCFDGCYYLQSIKLPNSLISIGEGALRGFLEPITITIPKNVEAIGYGAFLTSGTSGIQAVYVDDDNKYFSDDEGVLFDKAQTRLIYYPRLKVGTNYVIPASVLHIEKSAFFYNHIIKNVSLPDGIQSIESKAFLWCKVMEEINLPSSLIEIGEFAFNSCESLREISINKNIKIIGNSAFSSCQKLTQINVDPLNANYSSLSGVLFNKTGNELIQYPIGVNSSTYTVPTGITKLKSYSFQDAKLEKVILPNTLIKIEDAVFRDMDSLKTITIPKSVDTIVYNAFYLTKSLIQATFEGDAPKSFSNSSFSQVGTGFKITYKACKTGFSTPTWKGYPCSPESNCPPHANAGPDQSVKGGSVVTLDGSGSSDSDGNALTYLWTAPAGVTLSSNTSAKPTFDAAPTQSTIQYSFSLVVNDGTDNSTSDVVFITVTKSNNQPVANAGPDQTVTEGSMVTLNGSASSDSDENPLSYLWNTPAGIILNSNTSAQPTFTAPHVDTTTQYSFSLVVSDGVENSVPDEVTITVLKLNHQPVANAGQDQTVDEGSLVTLNGSQSSDSDNNSLT
jgi:hypothetical protein